MFKNVLKTLLLLSVFTFFIQERDSPSYLKGEKVGGSEAILIKQEKKSLRKEIVRFANSFKGKRYRSGGRGPNSFDCSGFTWFVMDHFNIKIPTNSWSQAKKGKPVKIEDARTGDLVFFGNKKGVNHVGIVVYHKNGKMKVIHSTTSKGIVIQDILSSKYWKSRLLYVRDLVPKRP